ncbi:GNAT family N-acetyltransferase [Tsukamurella soli]|uniref:GNAT family N-acetyltransferase n=1 Tax=Tsukamurella soli TaxID=644556 RepID=A0ABP8J1B4_9ACTN
MSDRAQERVRRVHLGDVDPAVLAALAARTFPLACPAELPPSDIAAFVDVHLSPSVFADHLDDPAAHVYLSGTATHPDGYALVLHGIRSEAPGRWAARHTAYISKIYVDAAQHGAGVAAGLMAAVLDGARADRCRAAFLGTNRGNARAKRFYAKSGFDIVGERRFTVGSIACIDDVLLLEL